MQSLAYLYQALAYESPPAVSSVFSNYWQSLLAKLRDRKLLAQVPTYLISLVIILSICSLTGSALARNLLRKGSSGEDVSLLQQKLAHAGLYSGPVNGKFGELTESAVKKFQGNLGLKVDGVVGSQTWAKLENNNLPRIPPNGGNFPHIPHPQQTPILPDNFPKAIPQYKIYAKKGDKGSKISYLQEELLFRGFYQGKIDGVYGLQTENAVKRFQSAHNLAITGFVDEFTLKELQKPVIDFELTQPPKPKTKFASVVVPISHTQKVEYLSKDKCAFPDTFGCSQDSSQDKVSVGNKQFNPYNNTYGAIRGYPSFTLPVISSGRVNERELVRGLQQILGRLGYNPGGIDGVFGSNTRRAVIRFQRSKDLNDDGVVGQRTWQALDRDLRVFDVNGVCDFLPGYCFGDSPDSRDRADRFDPPPQYQGNYVVAIPDDNQNILYDPGDIARRSTNEILYTIRDRNECPRAFYNYRRAKFGNFIDMGSYYNLDVAQGCSNALREAGLDARVIHRDRL